MTRTGATGAGHRLADLELVGQLARLSAAIALRNDFPARKAAADRIVAVFQNDMVATSWDPADKYWLLSLTGEANRSTHEVLAAAERLGYTPHLTPVAMNGASDHASFQQVGIAAANFSWRGENDGRPLLEPPYHTPIDTIPHNISLERLQVSLELIGSAAYATARRPTAEPLPGAHLP